jgi:hypothetical protein
MNNQEIFIIVVIVILVIMRFVKLSEGFEVNNFPCDKNPLNSNCTCPTDAPQRVVLGQFPMNYGEKSPYVYTCVPANAPEPPTTIWPNLDPNEPKNQRKCNSGL